ncbi:MAG TPA: DNA primase, partial [Candidatus Acidoferrales bacterium]|nr:DNA primase [Candidatus Acidoferrales bacterium]
MGRFGDDKIEEVRTRADIVEIVGAHVRLRRAGRNFVGLCPFHNEKTPSFSVNAERGFFHCFGCGVGGSVFNFIMRVEGLTFPEAVRSLARKYGVTLPEINASGPAASEREAMFKAGEVAAEFFSHVLWNTGDGTVARDYLKARGITVETARAFAVGFAPARPASLTKALERRSLRDAGVKVGLVKSDGSEHHDMFRGRVMFPIRDAQGRVLAFGGRVLDDRLPKYINSPESPLYSKTRTLYGLFEARQAISSQVNNSSGRAILVEGYFDVIALSQAGIKEAVAGCGTALTVEQLRLLSRYTKNVIACFDGDAAGRKASMRALEIFLQAGLLGRGIFIPAGFDPDTFVREKGAAAFQELADNAELLVDYFIRDQRETVGGPNAPLEKRAQAAAQVAEKLKLIDDEIQFNLIVRKAESLLGIDEAVIRDLARRPAAGSPARPRPQPPQNRPAATGGDAGTKAEIGLVAMALLRPELRAEIAESGASANFEDVALGAVLADLCGTDEDYAALEQWLAERLTPEQQSGVSEIAVGPLIDSLARDTDKVPDDLGRARA